MQTALKKLKNKLISFKNKYPKFVLYIGMVTFPIWFLVGIVLLFLFTGIALVHDMTIELLKLPYKTILD